MQAVQQCEVHAKLRDGNIKAESKDTSANQKTEGKVEMTNYGKC